MAALVPALAAPLVAAAGPAAAQTVAIDATVTTAPAPVLVPIEQTPPPTMVVVATPTTPAAPIPPAPAAPATVYVMQPPVTPAAQTVYLSEDDRETLSRGPYTSGEIVGGGLLAIGLGFGTGHLAQRRWASLGWVFTFGEIGSIALVIAGMEQALDSSRICDSEWDSCSSGDDGVGLVVTGALLLGGLRVWEMIDAFVAPAAHNDRYRELQFRLGVMPLAALPGAPGTPLDRVAGGLTLRF